VTASLCYARRVAGPLLVALALLGTIVAPGVASPPAVTWDDGTISATFEGVPADEALAAVARAIGVEVRGELHERSDIHARFDRVRFADVLDRLVGEQNFTITYDAAGRPRRVELLGMPEAPESSPVRGSPEGFGNLVTAHGEVSLPPVLADALGRPRADLPWVLRRSARHPDPAIAAAAVALFVRTVEAEPRLHDAFLRTDDARVTRVLRIWFGRGTEQLLGAFVAETRDPLLRTKARRLEQQLRVGPPDAGAPAT
jgi:hypothetical protein